MSIHLIECEPGLLSFRDVRINTQYTTSLTLRNSMPASVELELSPSSPLYSITPNRVFLSAHQSIVCTVTFKLLHYPTNYNKAIVNGGKPFQDYIQIKSTYFVQRLPCEYFLSASGLIHTATVRSRSVSPAVNRGGNIGGPSVRDNLRESMDGPPPPPPPLSQSGLNMSQVSFASGTRGNGGSGTKRPPSGQHHQQDKGDLIQELQLQLKWKDRKIEELQEMMGNLEAKHPNLDKIIDAKIQMERLSFEEKSEKVLQILRKKDAQIADLEEEVANQKSTIEAYQLELTDIQQRNQVDTAQTKDYFSGLTKPSPIGPSSMFEAGQEITKLKREIDRLQGVVKDQQSELTAMEHLQKEMAEDFEKTLSGKGSGRDGLMGSQRIQSMTKELQALREKTMDQADQIETLVGELSAFRKDNGIADQKLQHAVAENQQLRGERRLQEKHIADIEEKYNRLQADYDRLKATSSAGLTHSGKEFPPTTPQQPKKGSRREQPEPISPPEFERQVGGGLATATPRRFNLKNLKDDSTSIEVYKDMLEELEKDYDHVSQKLKESNNIEGHLRDRIKELETVVESHKTEIKDHKHTIDELQVELGEYKLVSATNPLSRASQTSTGAPSTAEAKSSSSVVDAGATEATAEEKLSGHEWWSYIWHELCKHYKFDTMTSGLNHSRHNNGKKYGEYDFEVNASSAADDQLTELQYHLEKMKDNLRLQAIEISSLRQDNLGNKLTLKREVTHLHNQIDALQRDKIRLESLLSHRKVDKETKINELQATIRILQARGDMFQQVANARSDLETERLTVFHLQAELDSYRLLLDQEQRKSQMLQKELSGLQGRVEAKDLASTALFNIPGVNPCIAIELMAQEMMQIRNDLQKAKGNMQSVQEELRGSQRQVMQLQQQLQETQAHLQTAATTTAGAVPGLSSGASVASTIYTHDSLSPSKRTVPGGASIKASSMASGLSNKGTPPSVRIIPSTGGVLPGSAASATSTLGAPTVSLEIDEMTSPQTLLQSFDLAMLQNRLAAQDVKIRQLEAELAQAQHSIASVTAGGKRGERVSVGGTSFELVDHQERIEWETSVKRLELANVRIDELKQEVEVLQEAKTGLEKRLSDALISLASSTVYGSAGAAPGTESAFSMLKGNKDRNTMNSKTPGKGVVAWVLEDDLPLLDNHTSDAGSSMADQHQRGGDRVPAQKRHVDGGEEENHGDNISPGAATIKRVMQREIDDLKAQLRDKLAENRVLHDTLEAMQVADIGVSTTPGVSGNTGIPEIDDLLNSHGLDAGRRGGDLLDRYMDGGNNSALVPSGSSSTVWQRQALVKRVIELTSELTAQTSTRLVEQKRLQEIENDNRLLTKTLSREQCKLQNLMDENEKLIQTKEILTQQVIDFEKQVVGENHLLTRENEKLVTTLREVESDCHEFILKLDEMSVQLQYNEQVVLEDFVKKTIEEMKQVSARAKADAGIFSNLSEGDRDRDRHENATMDTANTEGLRKMIHSLLTEWRESLGTIPSSRAAMGNGSVTFSPSAASLKLTKAEQRFYQKITDLVLNSHKEVLALDQEKHSLRLTLQSKEIDLNVIQQQVNILAQQLVELKRKNHSYEKALRLNHKNLTAKESRLINCLKKTLISVREENRTLTNALRQEKKEKLLNQVELVLTVNGKRKLKKELAMLESTGSQYLKGREEALHSIQEKVQGVERELQSWIQKELPRIVSGVPVREDTFAMNNYGVGDGGSMKRGSTGGGSADRGGYSGLTDMDAAGLGLGLGGPSLLELASLPTPITDTLLQNEHIAAGRHNDATSLAASAANIGVHEQTHPHHFALSQALCNAKAHESIQEMKILELQEKLSLEKQRNLRLEGVLLKWRQDIEDDHYLQQRSAAAGGNNGGLEGDNTLDAYQVQRLIYLSAEKEELLSSSLQQRDLRITELEEEVIELRGKLEQGEIQIKQARTMMEVVNDEDEKQRIKNMQQLNKLRIDLENEHAKELRILRESYEQERIRLIEELRDVAKAVDDAKLNTSGAPGSRGYIPHAMYWPTLPLEHKVERPPSSRGSNNDNATADTRVGEEGNHDTDHEHDGDFEADLATIGSISARVSTGGSKKKRDIESASTKSQRTRNLQFSSPLHTTSGRNNKNTPSPDTSPSTASSESSSRSNRDNESDDDRDDNRSIEEALNALANISASSGNNSQALREVEIDNLRRAIDLEKRKRKEARSEVKELEEMLHIQQRMMKDNVEKLKQKEEELFQRELALRAAATSAGSVVSATATGAGQNIGSGASVASVASASGVRQSTGQIPSYSKASGIGLDVDRVVRIIEDEVHKEDSNLWPSLSTLTDELCSILRTIFIRLEDSVPGSEDYPATDLIRSALAMTSRIKIVSSDMMVNAANANMAAVSASVPPFVPPPPPAHSNANNKASNGLTDSLQSLANRVKLIETDFSQPNANIPERYLYLLRDLRLRVTELESSLHSQLEGEREVLQDKTIEFDVFREQLQRERDQTIQTMKARYDESIRLAELRNTEVQSELLRLQESLSLQQSQCVQLQQQLQLQQAQSQQQIQQLQQQLMGQRGTGTGSITGGGTGSVTGGSGVPVSGGGGVTSSGGHNEFITIQRQLSQATDALEQSQSQSKQFEIELQKLRSDFQEFRVRSAALVRNLEENLEDAWLSNSRDEEDDNDSNERDYEDDDNVFFYGQQKERVRINKEKEKEKEKRERENGKDRERYKKEKAVVEDSLRKLEVKYRLKCSELEAVLKSLNLSTSVSGERDSDRDRERERQGGRTGGGGEKGPVDRVSGGTGTGSDTLGVGSSTTTSFSQTSKEIAREITEARLIAAEKEIDALQRVLSKERQRVKKLESEIIKAVAYRKGNEKEKGRERGRDRSRGESVERERERDYSRERERDRDMQSSTGEWTDLSQQISSPPPHAVPPPNTGSIPALANSTYLSAQPPYQSLFLREYSARDLVLPQTMPNNISDNETVRAYVKRVNTMRRQARTDIQELMDRCQQLQDALVKESAMAANKSNRVVQDLRTQITQLKDENTRKTKLLAALKAAKNSDSNALEQWKNEVKHLEETVKRLQRTLQSKDALTKDLRNKADALEEALNIAEKNLETNVNDMYTLSPAELRTKLKEFELERARSRSRMTALKEKITELEHEIISIKEENETLKKQSDKQESLRATLARKDTVITNLKKEVERLKLELDDALKREEAWEKESEKKSRQLMRQVENLQRDRAESERERLILRERLTEERGQLLAQQYDQQSHHSQYERDHHSASSILSATSAASQSQGHSYQSQPAQPPQQYIPASAPVAASGSSALRQRKLANLTGQVPPPPPPSQSAPVQSSRPRQAPPAYTAPVNAPQPVYNAPQQQQQQPPVAVHMQVPETLRSAQSDINDVMSALGMSGQTSQQQAQTQSQSRSQNVQSRGEPANDFGALYDDPSQPLPPSRPPLVPPPAPVAPPMPSTAPVLSSGAAVSSLLERLQTLSQVLPQSPSAILNHSSSSSGSSGTSAVSQHLLDISSSSGSSSASLFGSRLGGSVGNRPSVSEVEKRLQHLVREAIASPVRK